MGNAFNNVGLFLIEVIFSLFTYAVLARLFLQLVKADFYNPFCQLIIRITNPLLKPMRRIVPGFFGVDCAAIVLAYLTVVLQLILEQLLLAQIALVSWSLIWVFALVKLILAVIWLYIVLIFIRSIASWFSQGGYNPAMLALQQLTEPLLKRVRRFIPVTQSGLDFSPVVTLLILFCLQIFINSFFTVT